VKLAWPNTPHSSPPQDSSSVGPLRIRQVLVAVVGARLAHHTQQVELQHMAHSATCGSASKPYGTCITATCVTGTGESSTVPPVPGDCDWYWTYQDFVPTFSPCAPWRTRERHYAEASTVSIVCMIDTVSLSGISGLSSNPCPRHRATSAASK